MIGYLLPVALSLAVLVSWRAYVRMIRQERRRIIIRFTASTREMNEAMGRMTTAIRELNRAVIRGREAGLFDDYSESP